jgi:hypothetical protein
MEPLAHPPLRAITRVPRSHGYTDAVEFGNLSTASSRVVRLEYFRVCVCVCCVCVCCVCCVCVCVCVEYQGAWPAAPPDM